MITILIVDDSQFQRSFLKRVLSSTGYTILEAGNANEGLALIAKNKLHLILADLIMPVAGGFFLLEKLQKNASEIPVIIITADIQVPVREQCIKLGARSVLYKPVDAEELLKEVDKALNH